jgi:hypothetical protein
MFNAHVHRLTSLQKYKKYHVLLQQCFATTRMCRSHPPHKAKVKLSLCLTTDAMTIYGTGGRAPRISTDLRGRTVRAPARLSCPQFFVVFLPPIKCRDSATNYVTTTSAYTVSKLFTNQPTIRHYTDRTVLLAAVLMSHESTHSHTTI